MAAVISVFEARRRQFTKRLRNKQDFIYCIRLLRHLEGCKMSALPIVSSLLGLSCGQSSGVDDCPDLVVGFLLVQDAPAGPVTPIHVLCSVVSETTLMIVAAVRSGILYASQTTGKRN